MQPLFVNHAVDVIFDQEKWSRLTVVWKTCNQSLRTTTRCWVYKPRVHAAASYFECVTITELLVSSQHGKKS